MRNNRLEQLRPRSMLLRIAAAAYEMAMSALPVWLLLRQDGLPSAILPVWAGAAAAASLFAAVLQPLLLAWWMRLSVALVAGTVAVWVAGSSLVSWTGAALLAVGILQGATILNRSGKSLWPWTGVACYFAASAASQMRPEWHELTGLLAVLGTICLAVALTFTHERHLRSITLSERAAQRVPPEMRRHNRIYTAILVLGMLALAAGLGGVVLRAIRDAVQLVFLLFSSLLDLLFREDVATLPPEQLPPEPLPMMQEGASPLSRVLDMLLYVIGYLGVAALLIWGLSRIYRSRKVWWNRLATLWKAIWRVKPPAPRQHDGYRDEETSLFSWEESLARLRRNRFGQLLLRRREPGYEDMPDNREKIRFLYRSWLRKLIFRGFGAKPHLTPAEMLHAATAWEANPENKPTGSRVSVRPFRKNRRRSQPSSEDTRTAALIALYYQVRYRGIEPTDAQVEHVRQHDDARREP